MNRILILTLLAISLIGCRYVQTKETYLEAKDSPELKVPEGSSIPNSSALLEVPEATNKKAILDVPSSVPPEMPIRTKQNEDSTVRIENRKGYPVLVVKYPKEKVWSAIESLDLENWSPESKDQNSCQVILKYNDMAAREREKSGFLKKLFRRERYYVDYSGLFKLNCITKGSVTEVEFSKHDGSPAKSFLADNVMIALFEKLDETQK
jgi:uncharacterized lipoprotein